MRDSSARWFGLFTAFKAGQRAFNILRYVMQLYPVAAQSLDNVGGIDSFRAILTYQPIQLLGHGLLCP